MMKQLSFLKRHSPPVLRLFSKNPKKQDPPMTEDMQFRIPTFGSKQETATSIPSFVEESSSDQSGVNQKVEKMREHRSMSQATSQRTSPYLVQNNP
jgi:hypothetical protein